MRKAGIVALVSVAVLAGFWSCASKQEITIEILDPCEAEAGVSFKEAADYIEFAVFPNKCPEDMDLAAGRTKSARYTDVAPAGESLAAVGDLPKSKFGFAAVLRDKNCGVIGFGCTDADLNSITTVRIAVRAWATPDKLNPKEELCTPLQGGACEPPLTCNAGNCEDQGEGDAGACSLTVAAAGKLPAPVIDGARVSGPGVVATDNLFVIGYRDQDNATSLRAILMALNDDGTATDPAVFELGGCIGKQPTDGVGMAYEGGSGMLAASLPNCNDGKGAGAVFVPFSTDGSVGSAAGPRNGTFNDLTMAPSGGLAPAATTNEYEFLYRVVTAGPALERVVLQGPAFKSVPIVHPFGDDDIPFGMVATTPQVRAFLAPAACPTGGDAGTASQTCVLVGPRTSDTLDIPSMGSFSLSTAPWAALTAWDNRVAAGVPASAGLTLKVAQLQGSNTSVIANGLVGSTTVSAAAFAVLRSHLFVAAARAGGITIHRLADAKGVVAATPIESVEIPSSMGSVSLAAFDGTHVALAAARSRVAVVWLTKGKLGPSESTGGWALLRCAK